MTEFEKTNPYVFIIESLDFDDEEKQAYEGEIISRILSISNIEHKYYYIRTKREFEHFINEFLESNYRYLHISCHGNLNEISTTLDRISFQELGTILGDKLDRKRLFLSSCLSTNKSLAETILSNSDCFSIIGPNEEIDMDDAAIFWSSFYQKMFKDNDRYMKNDKVKEAIKTLKEFFNVSISYFASTKTAKGWKEVNL
ncbi:hypothetical protein [Chryseobacterium turcicum]|uniref:CHAT domain-containing protein n=1 Tax=Chryseobacterium turcicum TaxID=2898076 RepID=A0A9Q3V3N4_9FLAO|nr:hypothetical protein [Chryseobacterium turcicum]MCD1117557.1 hypothetical protein [Chryseobacterium turcicum]